MIENLVRYFFIITFLCLLLFDALIILAARRAAVQTGIPITFSGKLLIVLSLVFLLVGIIFSLH